MSDAATAPAHALPDAQRRFGFLNPYVQLAIGALLVTASELFLRVGAKATAGHMTGLAATFGLAALGSLWTWCGIVTYVLSFLSWIYVLRYIPLGIAFAAINVVHVTVPLGAYLILHEDIHLRRWIGIGLVICGLLLLIQQVVKAESKL
jgi:multidrug transporter EmrE-like cation transporter